MCFLWERSLQSHDRKYPLSCRAFVRIALCPIAKGLLLHRSALNKFHSSRERSEYAVLFDGFSFTGKIIALNIVINLFVFLWSMLFVVPGFIAYYRYRFALYNLYENPDMDIMEALNLSKRQTQGYKMELFKLDLSYMGWILLSMLPSLFFTSQAILTLGFSGMDPYAALAAPMPLWQILTASAFVYALSIFYLPNYQCVQLAYFDAAKEDMPEFRSRQSDFSDGPGSF